MSTRLLVLLALSSPALAGTDPRGDAPSWSWTDTGGDAAWPSVLLADTNGDGVQDLIVSDPIVDPAHRELDDPTRLLIFFGGATMSATPDVVFDKGSDVATSALGAWGDLDGDGDDDFVTWSEGELEGDRDVWVRWGGPGGPGDAQPLAIRDFYNPVGFGKKLPVGRIADQNGDGFGDVIFKSIGGPTRAGQIVFSVHLGNATGVEKVAGWTGSFDWPGLLGTDLQFIGDLDGDGYLETAATSVLELDPTTRVSEIDVYHGNEFGPQDAFWSAMSIGPTTSLQDLHTMPAGDLDGDGHDDVLVSITPRVAGEASRLLAYHGDPNYGFRFSDPEVAWRDAGGEDVRLLGVGDFDGDAVNDIAIGLPTLVDPLGVSDATGGVALGLATDVWFSHRTLLPFVASGDDLAFGALGAFGDTSGDGLADVMIVAPGIVDGKVSSVQRFLGFIDHDLDHSDDDVDCVPDDGAVYPGADEVWYDGIDQDCDGNDADQDLDGVPSPDDCDDLNADRHPGAVEVWYDGVDQDCDDNDADQDLDGVTGSEVGGDDCDDGNPDVGPFAQEVPANGLDDDCAGGDASDVLDAPTCGCASQSSPAPLGVALALLAISRRRRRA